MIASSFVYRRTLAVAACLIFIDAPRLYAQNAELPESIRLAHVRYADLAPLAITWTQTTEATPLGREKLSKNVLRRILDDGSFVQQLAFSDGQFYLRREFKGGTSWPPRTDEVAFDRNVFYAAHNLFYSGVQGYGEPKDRPYLHKWLPKNDNPEASYFQDDYFRAAGVRVPVRTKELVSSGHPQSELLALLAEGGRIEVARSAKLLGSSLFHIRVSTRTPQEKTTLARRYDFLLDPEKDYAVRRLEIRGEFGQLLIRSDCTELERLGGRSMWMPRLCRVEAFTSGEKQDLTIPSSEVSPSFLYVKTIQVSAFEIQPWPVARFQLNYTTSGVYVNDASFPEMTGKDGIFYQIPANPQRLDEVIAMRRSFYQAWKNAEKVVRPLRVLFLILNSLGLTGIGVYLFIRWRKKADCA